MNLDVICLEDEAFKALIDRVYTHICEKEKIKQWKWIKPEEAMVKLNIAKGTLQRYRDEGRIRFSHHDVKNIVYDLDSINEYLEKHANK